MPDVLGPGGSDEGGGPVVVEELVVAHGFPPAGGDAAVRTALRVRGSGRPVDVLHGGGAPGTDDDAGTALLTGDLVRRAARVPLPGGRAEAAGAPGTQWGPVRDLVEEGVQVALGWDRADGYRRLLSSAEPAAQLLAARVALQRPDVTWTAEAPVPAGAGSSGSRRATVGEDALADLLTEAVLRRGIAPPSSHDLDAFASRVTLALATRVLVQSERHLERLLDGLDSASAADVRARADVVPAPVPPADLYEVAVDGAASLELDGTRHHLGCFGRLDGARQRAVLLGAVAALPADVRAQVALHVWTEDAGALWRAARDRGVADALVAHRPVPYLESLALMRRMELLVVPDLLAPGHVPEVWPDRWADVQGSGVPVWGLVVPGSPLSGQPLHRSSPAGHVSAAVQVLAEAAAGRLLPAGSGPG